MAPMLVPWEVITFCRYWVSASSSCASAVVNGTDKPTERTTKVHDFAVRFSLLSPFEPLPMLRYGGDTPLPPVSNGRGAYPSIWRGGLSSE